MQVLQPDWIWNPEHGSTAYSRGLVGPADSPTGCGWSEPKQRKNERNSTPRGLDAPFLNHGKMIG